MEYILQLELCLSLAIVFHVADTARVQEVFCQNCNLHCIGTCSI